MTRYTHKELDREAMDTVRELRRETGKSARLDHWELVLSDGGHIRLAVIIAAHDGLRQRNVAI